MTLSHNNYLALPVPDKASVTARSELLPVRNIFLNTHPPLPQQNPWKVNNTTGVYVGFLGSI